MKTVWYDRLKAVIDRFNAYIDESCTLRNFFKLLILLFISGSVYSIFFTLNLIVDHDFHKGDWYDYYFHGPNIFVIKIRVLFLFQLLRFPFHRLLLVTIGGGGACLLITKYFLEANQAGHHQAFIETDFLYAILASICLLVLALLDKFIHLVADRFSAWGILFLYFLAEIFLSWPQTDHILEAWSKSNVNFRINFIFLQIVIIRYIFVALRNYFQRRT